MISTNYFFGAVFLWTRSTRPDYWWIWLANIILSIPFYMVYMFNGKSDSGAAVQLGPIGLLSFLVLFFFSWPTGPSSYVTQVSIGHWFSLPLYSKLLKAARRHGFLYAVKDPNDKFNFLKKIQDSSFNLESNCLSLDEPIYPNTPKSLVGFRVFYGLDLVIY